MNPIYKYSPYRAVKTFHLSYTNQSVKAVKGNNGCLFSYPHKTHINTLCGQNIEFCNVKLAVRIVTTGGTYSDHWAVNG